MHMKAECCPKLRSTCEMRANKRIAKAILQVAGERQKEEAAEEHKWAKLEGGSRSFLLVSPSKQPIQ